MKSQLIVRLASVTLAVIVNLPAHAGDVQGDAYGCDELWTLRNQIFKASGYCFKSPRAIKQFGNAGCQYDIEADVPLSYQDQQTLSSIEKSERRQGC
jgi:hypothetical protein